MTKGGELGKIAGLPVISQKDILAKSGFPLRENDVLQVSLQCIIHLGKGLLSLLKESKDNRATKLAIVLVVIHLQDLFKGQDINAVAEIWQANRTLLALRVLRKVSSCNSSGMFFTLGIIFSPCLQLHGAQSRAFSEVRCCHKDDGITGRQCRRLTFVGRVEQRAALDIKIESGGV
jgi:hypothetical protein